MSDVLIKNIQIPKDNKRLALFIDKDGEVTVFEGNEFNRITDAIEVPPHGDLIDRQKLLEHRFEVYDSNEEVCEDYIETYHVLEAPAIIEASKEGD